MAPPLDTIGVIVAPEQIVCDDGVATTKLAVGFTNTVAVLVQLLDDAVMTNVT